MSATFTLAHLSDVHLSPMPPFGLPHWRVKRMLGYVNWHRKRKNVHLRRVVDRIAADVVAQKPDHIAVTGDLVNIGLPEEHALALDWLRALGPADQVTVVPGNHDIYVRMRRDPGAMRWVSYMTSNAQGLAFAMSDTGFPFVRTFGTFALVGVNSAVATPPLIAAGRVGAAQLERLADTLDRLRRGGLFRIVLIHHPPLPGQASRTRGLADAPAFRDLIAAHGAELVLHGHNHTNMLASCRWVDGHIPVVGVPSASNGRPHGDEPLGRYNLYTITSTDSPGIEMVGRGLLHPDSDVTELERTALRVGEGADA